MGYMIQRLQPSSMKRYQKRKDIGKVTENNFEYVVVGVYGDWYKRSYGMNLLSCNILFLQFFAWMVKIMVT
jgi:hypothetical protein